MWTESQCWKWFTSITLGDPATGRRKSFLTDAQKPLQRVVQNACSNKWLVHDVLMFLSKLYCWIHWIFQAYIRHDHTCLVSYRYLHLWRIRTITPVEHFKFPPTKQFLMVKIQDSNERKHFTVPSLPTNFLLVFVGVFHPFTSPRLKQPHGGITLFGVGRFDGRLGPRHGGALPRRHGAAGGNQAIHLNNGLHGGRRGNPLPKQQQKWWTKCVGFFFEGCIYTMYSWCTGYISFCSDSLFFFLQHPFFGHGKVSQKNTTPAGGFLPTPFKTTWIKLHPNLHPNFGETNT